MHALPTDFPHSPFLTQLAMRHGSALARASAEGPAAVVQAACRALHEGNTPQLSTTEWMTRLRHARGEVALITAAADIAGAWSLAQVTAALSELADTALQQSVRHLLWKAEARGDIALPTPEAPEAGTGFVVLGMGKLGALELNYSSDIDLILFYEPGRVAYRGRHTEQQFYNKLAHDLVQLMQERTAEGYVFRTDLRLRPDPASTPPVVSVPAALAYYEGVGQNWERAAMIKARPVAGDLPAGEALLAQLVPFVWRRNLDFAAIQDVHSIKRQMDSKNGREVGVAGHNVKLGAGGIREIEFFVQIHQLIWGGKKPELRTRATCEALSLLAAVGLVEEPVRVQLEQAYHFLRMIEHRLQMVDDQQTHTLPTDAAALERLAAFAGFADARALGAVLTQHLCAVHEVFSTSFQSAERLGDSGALVFTGVSHDADTLATLSAMGYREPEVISSLVMSWHHGSRRCTRTKRARELMTELMPALLKHFGNTADPDAAFRHFDEFLTQLPAAVQIFALFTHHPPLLALMAEMLGNAPVLAETLSRHPALLEGVLDASFSAPLPDVSALQGELSVQLSHTQAFEEQMELLRRFRNEKQFQAGVQLLQGVIEGPALGAFLADLADVVLHATLHAVDADFARIYGHIPGARFAVVGLGRLGSREMTFGSDIDLVFVYDVPDADALSDGEKGFTASVYFSRFCQRVLSALTAMGNEGRLYEVDMRLRPSGTQGMMATSLAAMRHYFDALAWTFDLMALTRARPVAGDASLRTDLAALVTGIINRPRDAAAVQRDVAEMRTRVAAEFPSKGLWDLKYAEGGVMDVEFLRQYAALAHQPVPTLAEEALFLSRVLHVLRLCLPEGESPAVAPAGLQAWLARRMGFADFAALEDALKAVETRVRAAYVQHLISHP